MIDELYLLDSGPLGLVTNSRESDDARRCKAWMRSALEGEARVMAAEVTDYEVRRELIRAGKTRGLARLDTFAKRQGILAVDARAWQRAAELWAETRRAGRPTARGSALDADVILAAVAQLATEDRWRVVIVTENIGHLARFGDAQDWRTLAAIP